MVLLMAITTMLCARVLGLMVGHDARNNCNGVLVVKAAGSQLSHGVPWLRANSNAADEFNKVQTHQVDCDPCTASSPATWFALYIKQELYAN